MHRPALRPFVALLALLAVLAVACEDGGEPGTPPASPSPSRSPSAAPSPSPAATEAGAPGQGATVECAALGASWAEGVAVWRDGRYDVSGCRREPSGMAEMVKPAERDPERHDCALCNDGSPFGFRVQLAPEPSATWVVLLEGGAFCEDRAIPCRGRPTSLTSTPPEADGVLVGFPSAGLFNRDPQVNPAFAGANFVSAHYCSSDVWTGAQEGRRPTSAGPDGWHYAGHLNVRAMLEMLVERYGLDDADPETRVLFAGSSAGGVGVEANADLLAAYLPRTVEDGRARLVNDGGVVVEFEDPAYRPGLAGEPLAGLLVQAYERWGSRHLPACEAAQHAAGEHPGRCFLHRVVEPYIIEPPPDGLGLPLLVQYSSIDAFAIVLHGIDNPMDLDDLAALERWRAAALEAVSGSPWLFSGGASPYHTLLLSDAGWDAGPPGQTFGEVLRRFWETAEPERVVFGNPDPDSGG